MDNKSYKELIDERNRILRKLSEVNKKLTAMRRKIEK